MPESLTALLLLSSMRGNSPGSRKRTFLISRAPLKVMKQYLRPTAYRRLLQPPTSPRALLSVTDRGLTEWLDKTTRQRRVCDTDRLTNEAAGLFLMRDTLGCSLLDYCLV